LFKTDDRATAIMGWPTTPKAEPQIVDLRSQQRDAV